MANEIQPFNYGEIEPATAEKLKRHAAAIKGIQSKAIYEIGEELQAAHDELADHNGGTFYAWCESIGIGRDTVKRILHYHEYVGANCTNRDLIESLPRSLVYEAARPSTPQELKDKVASGDVTTLPEFKKLKAELEATKNVLRTTETKLDEAQRDAKSINSTLDATNIARSNDQKNFQERLNEKDEEIKELKQGFESSVIRETEKFKAEADQLREKASAYDDLQQMNHTLREKLRAKDEELLNRPEHETIVTKEVVPDDYERLKAENASMGKRLAEYEAHTQGLSLQEYAENSEDDDIRQYTKTLDEETAAAKQVRDVLRALECLPSDEAEMRELARCYMDWSVRRDETREDAQGTILRAQRKLDALAEQFGMGPKLKVVK